MHRLFWLPAMIALLSAPVRAEPTREEVLLSEIRDALVKR